MIKYGENKGIPSVRSTNIRYNNATIGGHSTEDEKKIRAATEAWHRTDFRSTTTMIEAA